eukprot:6191931-Pleurochrysis_carterae.AAC.2
MGAPRACIAEAMRRFITNAQEAQAEPGEADTDGGQLATQVARAQDDSRQEHHTRDGESVEQCDRCDVCVLVGKHEQIIGLNITQCDERPLPPSG